MHAVLCVLRFYKQRQPDLRRKRRITTLSDVSSKQTLARFATGSGSCASLGGGAHEHPPRLLPCLPHHGLIFEPSQATAMPSLPRFVVNESNGAGGERSEADEASSSESEQDEEADVTDAEEEDDGSDAEEPQQENEARSGQQTALPRSVPAEETPRAKLTFKLKKQRTSDEVCHVRVHTVQRDEHRTTRPSLDIHTCVSICHVHGCSSVG